MPELKTQKTTASVAEFLGAIPDDVRQSDAKAVCKLLTRITGAKPAMWGKAIIGFGRRTLVYPNGRTLDWMAVGFSPRKANTVLYIHDGPHRTQILARLGKHKTGKACLYINKLGDVDSKVLEELIERSVRHAKSA